jgi:uracil-DNA glycosylase family 4
MTNAMGALRIAAPGATTSSAAPTAGRGALDAVRDAIVACERCPRLRSYCGRIAREKKAAHREDEYWGRPVPGFGDPAARLLVVGLAPAAHGANRTGRVFTGDGSGDFLMRAMHDNGFASIPTARHAGDGLALRDAYILSVVRCAPPDNKPAPDEVVRCRVHLGAELAALPRVQVVLALGKIGWDGYLAYLRETLSLTSPRPVFGHGAVATFAVGPTLLGSYHPSRQNTNTGRLTPPMLSAVFADARRRLG